MALAGALAGCWGERGVTEVHLRGLPPAHQPADDLPDAHQLAPDQRRPLGVAEAGVCHPLVQQFTPAAVARSAQGVPGGVEVRLGPRLDRGKVVLDLLDGPLIQALGHVSQVVGARVRTDEEVGGADGGDVVVVEDVVAALDREQRRDQDPGAGLLERGDLPARQRHRSIPGLEELLIVGHHVPDLVLPARTQLRQRTGDAPGLGVAAGQQQHAPAALLQGVAVALQDAAVVPPGLDQGPHQRREGFGAPGSVHSGHGDRALVAAARVQRQILEAAGVDDLDVLAARPQHGVDRHADVVAR